MIAPSPFEESERILREHEAMMEESINAMVPREGLGVKVRGTYPVFSFSGSDVEPQEIQHQQEYQLKATTGGISVRFSRGRVRAGSWVVIPTIGGVDVDQASASLPFFTNGAQVFARYKFTLDPLLVAPNWGDIFVDCELIQTNLFSAPPNDTLPFTGINAGVDLSEGVAHRFLMAYDSFGRPITYGQSRILPPDPNNVFPTDTVIIVTPLIQYVD